MKKRMPQNITIEISYFTADEVEVEVEVAGPAELFALILFLTMMIKNFQNKSAKNIREIKPISILYSPKTLFLHPMK